MTQTQTIRLCKSCERELCQPYCERCGVWTRTEAEEHCEHDWQQDPTCDLADICSKCGEGRA